MSSKVQSDKQKKVKTTRMNEAVERALVHNILTCPPVDSSAPATKKSHEVNVHNAGSNYEAQKPKATENGEIQNLVKLERLKDLLERINHQKKIILDKIERDEVVNDHDAVLKNLEKLSKEATIEQQQKKSDEACKNAELLTRETKLAEREKQLEHMIRNLYKKQKEESAAKRANEAPKTLEVMPPVEIIIKVKPSHDEQRVTTEVLNVEAKKLYPKTPKKSANKEKPKVEARPVEPVEKPKMVQGQTQTSPTGSERLKPILKKPEGSICSSHFDDSSASTAYASLPEKVILTNASTKRHQKLNPALMHYIARLLGMNKNIGNQLSVNVSSVTTPSSSVVDTSGNNESSSSSHNLSFDNKRFEQLQHFINQNYSFLSEINETLDRSQIQEQTESNIKKVEEIWRDNLRGKKSSSSSKQSKMSKNSKDAAPKEAPKRPPPPRLAPQFTQMLPPANIPAPRVAYLPPPAVIPPKPARDPPKPPITAPSRPATASSLAPARQQPQLLRPSSVQPQSQPPLTNSDMLNVASNLESHMLNNFTEYTANCQKRIEELASMMERVRMEKMKLIENSLSSGEFAHHTEYRDIAFPAPTTSASDAKETISQREDPPSEEINSILQKQTRPFGVSKDSGISMISRPVTSSDFRDSPDTRMTSEERENSFQPILRDIPKPLKTKVTTADAQSEAAKDLITKEMADSRSQKSQKPPVSLNRLSPHLEKPHEAHELSTIAEVETPSVSKVNLVTFPTFEEFASRQPAQPLGDSAISLDASSYVPGDRSRLAPLLAFDEFKRPKPVEHKIDTSEVIRTLEEMKLKSFTKPEEFGIEELSDCDSNASSMIDIVQELKNRQIIETPFQNRESPTVPSGQVQPTEETATSDAENDTLSGIQDIEKEGKDSGEMDLPAMGLNWAASMLKRRTESKKNLSSNSNSSDEKGKSMTISIEISKGEASPPKPKVGQPLNLREFLTRELNKSGPSSETCSNESSLSSEFMRSLLNATAKSSSDIKSPSQSSDEKLRTSTPVKSTSHSHLVKSSNTQAFLGDSLSTLKSSGDDDNEK